jgi:hypothetical protein
MKCIFVRDRGVDSFEFRNSGFAPNTAGHVNLMKNFDLFSLLQKIPKTVDTVNENGAVRLIF